MLSGEIARKSCYNVACMAARTGKVNRVFFLLGVSFFLCAIIIGQLFRLQVINKNFYLAKAEEGHLGYSEVNARRGEILIKDYQSGEIFRLATNTTLPLLYADPTLVKDPAYLADKLSPLLFDLNIAQEQERKRIREQKRLLPDNASTEDLAKIIAKSDEELRKDFRTELFTKLSQKTRQTIILYQEPSPEIIDYLTRTPLAGIKIDGNRIIASPLEINDPEYTAKLLSPIIEIPYERLRELLKGRNRYTVLRQKVSGPIEQEIRKLISEDKKAKTDLFTGLNFEEKNYRYYPEGSLASQVTGFVSEKGGTYGIEQSFDTILRGKKGIFKTKLDATGQQVIVGDDLIIQPAIDGADVMLTIDRSIQMEVEKMLSKAVRDAKADAGLAVIMDPKTGRIISMAHYPTFDPNEYSKALETEDIVLTNEQISRDVMTIGDAGSETHYLYLDWDSHYRMELFKTIMESGRTIYSKFKNGMGARVFRNRAVSDIFEPGSVFKSVAMSIALDDGDVTPQTKFNDTGPIKVDEFEIHNSTDQYKGITTMTEVLDRSLNTGMAFVARKMGRELFYKYLLKYGFGERTDIEFEGELAGTVQEPNKWAESELITYAFGQGIAVTPIQLITAVGAMANGGVLMKPHIVQSLHSANGKVTEIEPEQVRRVISEKAAATITAMMVSAVENGVARRAGVPGYHIAGKTGTAQTYKNGKPLTGPGTTIVDFIGYAPVKDPKFAVLLVMDRPRSSIWADATVAPLFNQLATFLFKYYNIPPDA